MAENITDAELEILRILWRDKKATVKEVHQQLSSDRDVGYTTTLKQMQVMFEKGLLTRDDSQRQHIYFPSAKENQVQKKFMDKLMSTFFKGSATKMVLQALDNYKASPEELEEITKLIEKAKKGYKK
ncbi:BlaI/MecI/CopY family transcriptional regulator [Chitinophagaceae bacterium MMS25-I14]